MNELFPPTQPDPLDEEQVSPQEQAQYNQVVKHAATAIYKSPEAIVAALKEAETPIHVSAGRIAAQIGMAIEQKAEASGDKLSPDVMFHAGDEVIGMILDLGIKAGVVQVDPESEEYQKLAGMALMEASKAFGERILADPKQQPLATDEAGNVWAQQVAREVEAGTADPAFMQTAQGTIARRTGGSPVAQGVNQALRGR